jgi:hypothetical protein
MRKAFLLLALLVPSALWAQQGQTSAAPSNPLGGNIVASSTNCSVAQACVWMKLPANTGTVALTLSGTFSGTFLVEESSDGGNTFTTAATYTTAQTAIQFATGAMTDVRVRCSAYTSGNAGVVLQASSASPGLGNSVTGNPVSITTTTPASGSATGITMNTNSTYGAGDTILAIQNNGSNRFTFQDAGAGGVFTATGNVITGRFFQVSGSISGQLNGNIADGATAKGIILNNATTLSTGGAKLVSIQNNGVEKAFFDLNGVLTSAGNVMTGTIASGTAAMGTSAITSGSCATVVTVSATNVATTDVVKAGFNTDPTAITGYGASATGAVLTIYAYPTSGNVNFKVCNSTGNTITPSALTLNWTVQR